MDVMETEILRGERAQQLLRDELLVEAFEIIDADLTAKWRASPVRDTEGRESLYLQQALLQRLQAQLHLVVSTGQLAKATLVQRATRALQR